MSSEFEEGTLDVFGIGPVEAVDGNLRILKLATGGKPGERVEGMRDDIELTPGVVRGLWAYMTERYDTQVVHKSQAIEMHAIGRILQGLGILDHDRFMRRYTTVMLNRIYTPFEVGEADDMALFRQVVVCVHEHQHVVQFRRVGYPRYALGYVLSPRKRALYEAEAYCCNLEMAWSHRGELPDLEPIAAKLGDYGCGEDDIAAALGIYEEAAEKIRDGAISTEASRVAIEWFEERSL